MQKQRVVQKLQGQKDPKVCVCVCVLCLSTCMALTSVFSTPQLEECALQVASNGNYLDIESSLAEQKDELEQFYEDLA